MVILWSHWLFLFKVYLCAVLHSWKKSYKSDRYIVTMRRYASIVYAVVFPSVCVSIHHKPALYQNSLT